MKPSMVRWMEAWTYRWMDIWMNWFVKLFNTWNVWINRLIGKLRLNGSVFAGNVILQYVCIQNVKRAFVMLNNNQSSCMNLETQPVESYKMMYEVK